MSAKLLTPTALLKGDQLVHGESVLIEEGRIVEIGTGLKADSEEELEGVLLPGAIDLQVNGAGGRSVEEGRTRHFAVNAELMTGPAAVGGEVPGG